MLKAKDSDLPMNDKPEHFSSAEEEANHVHEEVTDSNDVLVFCGYSPESRQLLEKLTAAYKTDQKQRPRLVFVEPEPGIEKASSEFEIYRTGPSDTDRCEDEEAKEHIRIEAQKNDRPLTMRQIRGYDAVQILWRASQLCMKDGEMGLSRSCLLKQLNSGRTYPGVCGDYSFADGENIMAAYSYFAYGSLGAPLPAASSKPSGGYQLPPQEVLHMLATREWQPSSPTEVRQGKIR
jgi:hypothetical protein